MNPSMYYVYLLISDPCFLKDLIGRLRQIKKMRDMSKTYDEVQYKYYFTLDDKSSIVDKTMDYQIIIDFIDRDEVYIRLRTTHGAGRGNTLSGILMDSRSLDDTISSLVTLSRGISILETCDVHY